MSKRDVRRINKTAQERYLRSLDQEKDRLQQAEANLGWLELDHPIRDGWEKSLVLRADISAREDAATYLKLLSAVNRTIYSPNKTFMAKNWSTKLIEFVRVEPKEFTDAEFEKEVAEELRKFFVRVHKISTRWYGNIESDVWCVSTPWVFDEKMKKHYKTRVHFFDSEIKSRLKEIDNHIETGGLHHKYYKMKGWKSWRKSEGFLASRIERKEKMFKKDLEDIE